ncbi:trans-sialidase, putative, partial [Trypanosoma cruzi]
MLSRVTAVKGPRTHNRRRMTGSSGRRRKGRESEPQRPNMSRRVFTSAVLLLFVMMCCGTGGAVQTDEKVGGPNYKWKDMKSEGDGTVDSLGVPGLLKVGSDVFAVAEAQCKKDGNTVFTGIASQLLTIEKDKEPKEEVLKNAKEKTQVLEEVTSGKGKKVDVSRPTTVVDESDIYMLVGKHSHDAADNCQAGTENIKSGMLLVKVQVSGEADKKIDWKTTDGVPCTLGEKHESWTGLIGGGGSGVKMNDGRLAFPVEATKKEEKYVKAALLIICSSKEVTCWKLSKGMSADGCGVPSVVEWEKKDKLIMMTACDGGRRRVYEIGDKGESWTEALGTLSRVWGYPKGNERSEKGVRSGFITANIGDGVEDNRNVMLVTLPVYSKEDEKDNLKGVLHLWLTDNTHIVDIGPVSEKDDDVTASSLLYKSGGNGDKKEELIALYEKKGDADTPSLGMVSVLLTAQLEKVKEVLKTWKEVDKRVSKLCPSSAAKDAPTDDACATDKITDGLVGFLSGNFSGTTWSDEYLGVNAAVKKGAEEGAAEEKAEKAESSDGVNFQGAW